jgi:hypothetical protein
VSEGTPAECWIDLPPAVDAPLEVFVNGVLQQPDVDYRVDGRSLVFGRLLAPEQKLSRWQWARAALGIAGTYADQHLIDVVYERDGRRAVATGLRPRVEPGPPA